MLLGHCVKTIGLKARMNDVSGHHRGEKIKGPDNRKSKTFTI